MREEKSQLKDAKHMRKSIFQNLMSQALFGYAYDAIGNPLSYYNISNYTFTWEGRRLITATKNGVTRTYTYNDEGMRTSKTVNGVTTRYYYDGSLLISEETDGKITVYLYDANGSPVGFRYREDYYAVDEWDHYWFEKNLQGDIIAVYDSEGNKVAYYAYTAWGVRTVLDSTTEIPDDIFK